MYLTLAITAALCSVAGAQQTTAASIDPTLASLYSVIVTALPTSLLQLAATNTPAVASVIASELDSGSTPSWFAALPADVKSYLLGPGATMFATATQPTGNTASGNSYNTKPTSVLRASTPKTSAVTAATETSAAASPLAESSTFTTTSLTTTHTPKGPGLSTGAKVGIGVGANIAFIGLVGMLALLLYFRRKKGLQGEHGETGAHVLEVSPEPYPDTMKEVSQAHTNRLVAPHELDAARSRYAGENANNSVPQRSPPPAMPAYELENPWLRSGPER